MKKVLIAICLFVSLGVALADDKPVSPHKPAPRIISVVDTKLLDASANAAKRVEEAKKRVEESPVWKDYEQAKTQQSAVTLFIMAEMGIKPSEECAPVTDKEGRVVSFECPVKEKKEVKQ